MTDGIAVDDAAGVSIVCRKLEGLVFLLQLRSWIILASSAVAALTDRLRPTATERSGAVLLTHINMVGGLTLVEGADTSED